MNFKAILLVYSLQLLVGAVWYSAAPADVAQQSRVFYGVSVASMIGFAVALFVYTYFSAWLLAKTNLRSSFDRFVLTVSSWLFVVIPNIYFMSMFVDMSHMGIGYLLSFGFISCLIAGCILPFWRASRSIFKG
ncbi:hypothetical protein MAQ5080_00196 [Marinomonas aquimarina]|uniref:Uncharacterized protein n=1 Tax=Marinomonas aquimarina TaxID=295068 RepID=A0A1A8T343_9GAMM|nr:hypothetical protein [Marinomonas aquimarina]SBS25151.1 hypothetical protein MAQ5080_00196 [Marinomonas aquimarina]